MLFIPGFEIAESRLVLNGKTASVLFHKKRKPDRIFVTGLYSRQQALVHKQRHRPLHGCTGIKLQRAFKTQLACNYSLGLHLSKQSPQSSSYLWHFCQTVYAVKIKLIWLKGHIRTYKFYFKSTWRDSAISKAGRKSVQRKSRKNATSY